MEATPTYPTGPDALGAIAEVAGIPVFMVEEQAGGRGPVSAGLTFRVGEADESFPRRGHTHLIEHLALSRIAGLYDFNGSVDAVSTTFSMRGRPEEASEFLSSVVDALADLPYERMHLESQVLRSEWEARSGNSRNDARSFLFGPAGYGLVGYPELGLEAPDVDLVDRWRKRNFTRHNVALWMTAPIHTDLNLSRLPDGKLRRPPTPQPVLEARPQMLRTHGRHLLTASVLHRSQASTMLLWVLQQRLTERLRHSEGRSYAVRCSRENWGAHQMFVAVQADSSADQAPAVAEAVRVELARLTMDGPTRTELRDYQLRMTRRWEDPTTAASEAANRALNHLVGFPNRSRRAQLDGAERVTPEEVAAAAFRLSSRAIWMVPGPVAPDDQRLRPVPLVSDWRVQGTRFTPVAELVDGATSIIVAPGQLGWEGPNGEVISMDLDQVVAMVCFEDGSRLLWDRSGFSIEILPGDWLAGDQIVAHLDTCVAPEARVVTSGRLVPENPALV